MKASSASGLCARWIVCGPLAATRRLPGGRRCRLLVKRVEILCVLAVLGPLARALRRLVREEVAIRASCPRAVALQLDRALPQPEREKKPEYETTVRFPVCESRR